MSTDNRPLSKASRKRKGVSVGLKDTKTRQKYVTAMNQYVEQFGSLFSSEFGAVYGSEWVYVPNGIEVLITQNLSHATKSCGSRRILLPGTTLLLPQLLTI